MVSGRKGRRRGVVLVTVVLLMFALTLLAHGTLLVASAALRESSLLGDAVRVRRAALSAVELALGRPWNTPLPAPGRLPGGLEVELYQEGPGPHGLLTLEARARAGLAEVGARQLAWGLRPRAWLSTWTGWATTRAAPDASSAARLSQAQIRSCTALGPRPAWGRLPGTVPAPPSAARLDSVELRHRLEGSGMWRPGPVLVIADTVTGLIVTPGQVRLASGAVVRGALLAGGDVILDAGSEMAGVIQGGAGIGVAPGARLTFDPCGALESIRGTGQLLRPLAVHHTRGLTP